MSSRNLQKLVKTVRDNLGWAVTEKTHEMPDIRVVSYPYEKSHLILLPAESEGDLDLLQYLHELGRATFAETIHPVFAGVYFFSNHNHKKLLLPAVPALSAATDWFVGHWLLDLCPAPAKKALKEHAELAEEILGEDDPPPADLFLQISKVIAQAIHYLGSPVDCGGLLKEAVAAFHSVPPDQPSADACKTLVNRLMPTYTHHRVRVVDDGDYGIWEVSVLDRSPESDISYAGLQAN
jgi:hypothetical protein